MLKGSLVAIVTPFKDRRVDEETLRELIEFHVANGTQGIVPCGTTGESPTLSHDEHKKVVEIVVQAVAKRVPVVAGCGSNSTAEAIDLTKHAKKVGADAALHVTPYYNKPTQEGIFRHFAAIVKEAALPVVPYNIASRTGVNITPQTMARLAEMPEVIAVKEASGNLAQMSEILNLCGDKLDLLSGDDVLTLPVLAIGGKGVISVVNNIVPREVADMVAAWEKGDIADAQKRFDRLLPLSQAMFIETNPICIKTAAALLGRIPSGEMRLPLCEMAPANLDKLKTALKAHGLLS